MLSWIIFSIYCRTRVTKSKFFFSRCHVNVIQCIVTVLFWLVVNLQDIKVEVPYQSFTYCNISWCSYYFQCSETISFQFCYSPSVWSKRWVRKVPTPLLLAVILERLGTQLCTPHVCVVQEAKWQHNDLTVDPSLLCNLLGAVFHNKLKKKSLRIF